MFALVSLLIGEALLLAGLALASLPAAMVAAGVQLVAVGLLRSEGES